MKVSLSVRYLLWLVSFMLFFAIANFAVDIAYGIIRENEQLIWSVELTELSWFVAVNLLMLPVVLAVGWRVVRRMIHPIHEIADTAEKIAAGALESRIPISNPLDETGRLAGTLNRAFDKYDDVLEQLRRFSASASHQLRSPLAAIRSRGEITLSRSRTREEYQSAIAGMLEQVGRLTRIVEQLLDLSKLERRVWSKRLGSLSPSKVLEATVREFRPLLEDRKINLLMDAPDEIRILGDGTLLMEAFGNILDNAIRFTPESGTIHVAVRRGQDSQGVITISDTGPGIPEPFRAKVFERFEQGNCPEHNGTGLGLAIVAEIVHLHKGFVEARVAPSGGLMIYIEIPVLPNES